MPEQNPTRLIRAGDLCSAHMGAEVLLPGRWEPTQDPADTVIGTWANTWAPITRILYKANGTIKVRRSPDAVDGHTLDADTVIEVRQQPTTSSLDEALAREAVLREELEDAWAKAVDAAGPEPSMPPFVPAAWIRAILDDADVFDVARLSGGLPLATIQSIVVDVLTHHDWANEEDPNLSAAHGNHHYDGRCAVCRRRLEVVARTIAHRICDVTEENPDTYRTWTS